MESLTENTSLSWWFKHNTKNVIRPDGSVDLASVSYVSVRRNLEKLIAQSLGGGREAHAFFLAIAAGKLRIPTASNTVSASPAQVTSTLTNTATVYVPDVANFSAVLPADATDFERQGLVVPPNQEAAVTNALRLCAVILGSVNAPYFLKELVSGRFNGL